MQKLPLSANEADILTFIQKWVDAIAAKKVEEAYEMLDQRYDEVPWTPHLIRECIEEYIYLPEEGAEPPWVTPIEQTRIGSVSPGKPYQNISFFEECVNEDGIIGDIHFDLPIDYAWSDLTAIFYIRKEKGALTIELHDIHVL